MHYDVLSRSLGSLGALSRRSSSQNPVNLSGIAVLREPARSAPPPTNRGVQKTGGSRRGAKNVPGEGCNAMSCDWLEGTMPDEHLDWLRGLVEGDWVARERGLWGWPCSEVNGDVKVAFGSHRTIHLQMGGAGLMQLRCQDGFDEFAFYRELKSRGLKVCRVDVAFDDRSGWLDLEVLRSELRCGRSVATRYRKFSWTEGGSVGRGAERDGLTLVLGSRKSESFIRMYDKGLEQNVLSEGEWIRLELQTRDDQALRIFDSIAESGGYVGVAGHVRSLLDFKAYEADDNKHRVPSAGWWESFWDGCARGRLAVSRSVVTVASTVAALKKQWGPNIAAVTAALGGSVDWIYDALAEGQTRLRSKHLAMIAAARVAVDDVLLTGHDLVAAVYKSGCFDPVPASS